MKFKIDNIVLALIVVFIFTRLLFIYFPFWGLEYEDSFIFTDTGRYLSYSYDFSSSPFKCQSCLDGSYKSCYKYGSFGGHFLSIPILLSLINSIFGYHIYNIFFLNFVFSLFTLFLLFFYWNKLNKNKIFSLNITLTLLCVTPFLTIFNTSGLSETISSFLVIGFLFNIYEANENNYNPSLKSFWLLVVFMILAISVKRENLTLFVFLFFIPCIRYLFGQKPIIKSFILLFGLTFLLITAFSFFIEMYSIENNESGDIGKNTFSINFLITNLKQLLFAILNFKYWGITGYILFASILVVLFTKQLNKFGFMALSLSLFYIIVYSSHYRSYYQVVHNISYPFETLRYSTNYIILIILFISTVFIPKKEGEYWRILNSKISQIIFISIFVILIANNINTRINLSQDEDVARIQPVKNMLELSNIDDIIITSFPIIFRCYAEDKQKIIDLFSLNQNRLLDLISINPQANIYVMLPNDNEIDSVRYRLDLDYINFRRIKFESQFYQLLKHVKQ